MIFPDSLECHISATSVSDGQCSLGVRQSVNHIKMYERKSWRLHFTVHARTYSISITGAVLTYKL